MVADINAKLKDGSWRPVAGKEVVVELVPAGDYWLAEDYHQQYLEKVIPISELVIRGTFLLMASM